MPQAAIPFLIASGVMAGGQVAGAVIGAKASKKASQQQVQAENKALALQRQMYDEAKPRYQPYQDLGQSVLPTLRNLAGNVQAPRYGTNLSQLSVYGSPAEMARPVGAGQTPAASQASGGTVQIQAPNGQVKAVDRRLVDHYVSLGGKVVG